MVDRILEFNPDLVIEKSVSGVSFRLCRVLIAPLRRDQIQITHSTSSPRLTSLFSVGTYSHFVNWPEGAACHPLILACRCDTTE
jgi:hypothetical protein